MPGFTGSIVPRPRLAAHADIDTMILEQLSVSVAGVFHPPIRVMHHSWPQGFLAQRHAQRTQREGVLQGLVEPPSDHPLGVGI